MKTKEKLIGEILDNPVYMPDSDMCIRLKSRLLILSKDDLGCLRLILEQKHLGEATCPSPAAPSDAAVGKEAS